MKKFFSVIVIIIILSSIFTLVSYAHSGRTDSKGGHYDRTTGEYHYHHGYSAHQHPNGICPYKNSSDSLSSSSSQSKNPILSVQKDENDDTEEDDDNSQYGIVLLIFIISGFVLTKCLKGAATDNDLIGCVGAISVVVFLVTGGILIAFLFDYLL